MFNNIKIKTKLLISFIFFAFLIGFIGIFSLFQLTKPTQLVSQEIPTAIEQIKNASYLDSLAQFIRYYDEVLTQSARNYVFTQDKKWETRYNSIVPKLDEKIKEALEKGDEEDKKLFASVDTANLALVDMEIEAINLVNNEQINKATAILDGDEYWKQKEIYQQGLVEYVEKRGAQYDEALQASTQTLSTTTQKIQGLIGTSTILIFFLTVVSFIFAISIGVIIPRSISEPIARLQNSANNIA